MKTRPGSVSHLVTPIKAIADRFAFSALVLLSIAIMVVGKADPSLVQRVRASVGDVTAPVLDVLGRPVTAVTNAGTYLRDILTAVSDNQRLRAENETLLQWQQVARRLEAENAALRGLLKYQPEPTSWFVTAKVIGTAGGAFTRNLLVNRGSEDHLVTGQAAASGTGLVGRVMEVGRQASRVLLITDINSRIPVTVDTTHDRGILAGDNTDRPELLYLPPHSKIAVGDHIVTSGDGGVFPPGLPVGTVSALEGSKIRIEPMADLSRIDYLRIIDFGLSGMLPPDAVPAPKAPKHGAAPRKP